MENNMVTEYCVSFETAKLLKEKGFDGKCHAFYRKTLLNNKITDKAELHISTHLSLTNSNLQDKLYKEIVYCVAPTLQMAMKWLRKEYNIHIEPRYFPTPNIYRYVIIHSPVTFENIDSHPQYFNTNEEACEAAIKYCLENLI